MRWLITDIVWVGNRTRAKALRNRLRPSRRVEKGRGAETRGVTSAELGDRKTRRENDL